MTVDTQAVRERFSKRQLACRLNYQGVLWAAKPALDQADADVALMLKEVERLQREAELLQKERDTWKQGAEIAGANEATWIEFAREKVLEAIARRRKDHEALAAKDTAYQERDQLVAALSKVFPAHLMRHEDSDKEWEDDWRWIVCVELPTGQATWHIHDSELPWFDHLERRAANTWDGHTTEEKYRRLEALTPKETTK